jgi:hypothetical protein
VETTAWARGPLLTSGSDANAFSGAGLSTHGPHNDEDDGRKPSVFDGDSRVGDHNTGFFTSGRADEIFGGLRAAAPGQVWRMIQGARPERWRRRSQRW